jgi:SPP1 family predicted phage head-tail adaptor
MRGGGLRGCCGGSSKAATIIPNSPAGLLRQRITIQVPSLVSDNRGGGVYQWSDVATVWAQIKTYTASDYRNREQFQESQLRAKNEFLITMRYTPDTITTAMRVLWNGFSLEILAITNIDVLNWTMELYVREEGLGEP